MFDAKFNIEKLKKTIVKNPIQRELLTLDPEVLVEILTQQNGNGRNIVMMIFGPPGASNLGENISLPPFIITLFSMLEPKALAKILTQKDKLNNSTFSYITGSNINESIFYYFLSLLEKFENTQKNELWLESCHRDIFMGCFSEQKREFILEAMQTLPKDMLNQLLQESNTAVFYRASDYSQKIVELLRLNNNEATTWIHLPSLLYQATTSNDVSSAHRILNFIKDLSDNTKKAELFTSQYNYDNNYLMLILREVRSEQDARSLLEASLTALDILENPTYMHTVFTQKGYEYWVNISSEEVCGKIPQNALQIAIVQFPALLPILLGRIIGFPLAVQKQIVANFSDKDWEKLVAEMTKDAANHSLLMQFILTVAVEKVPLVETKNAYLSGSKKLLVMYASNPESKVIQDNVQLFLLNRIVRFIKERPYSIHSELLALIIIKNQANKIHTTQSVNLILNEMEQLESAVANCSNLAAVLYALYQEDNVSQLYPGWKDTLKNQLRALFDATQFPEMIMALAMIAHDEGNQDEKTRLIAELTKCSGGDSVLLFFKREVNTVAKALLAVSELSHEQDSRDINAFIREYSKKMNETLHEGCQPKAFMARFELSASV